MDKTGDGCELMKPDPNKPPVTEAYTKRIAKGEILKRVCRGLGTWHVCREI